MNLRVFLFFLAVGTRALSAQSHVLDSMPELGRSILDQAKTASGGDRWDDVQQIEGEGQKMSFGLTGAFHVIDQLATGLFARQANYRIFSNAEGMDRQGRWRLDNSSQIHPLNSEEAKTVAASESYISVRGYFFPNRFVAILGECKLPSRSQQACVWVTPIGGRAMALWFDIRTHLLKQIEMQLSVGSERFLYGDYQRVDGILLPFTFTIDHGDESESGTARFTQYHVSRTGTITELLRPQNTPPDSGIISGATETVIRGFLDEHSGFFIIEAMINGQGPYPFILDTGGHDILTPEMAHRLGLPTLGKGFSTGAGEGTTATEFTTVSTLALGEAVMRKQPFTILHIDLGTTTGATGEDIAIAGILGLELFERFTITLDYKAQKVTLRPAEGYAYHGSGAAIPIRFTSDMPTCAGSIDGHSGVFGIDTGNNIDVIIFPVWASDNALNLHTPTAGVEATSIGGNLKLSKSQVEQFMIGGFDLGAMEVLLSSDTSGSLSARAEAGNIGNSVLSRFTITYAFQSGNMYWERADPPQR